MNPDNALRTRLRPLDWCRDVKWKSGEQVTESFNIPEGFLNCMVLDSQPTKSVSRRVRLAIERNIDEMCPKQTNQEPT